MAVISLEQTEVGVRQNATMERLTILATIFLPLTFVTGFFGQNFAWLVGNIDGFGTFLFFGIGGLVLPCVLLYLWLRHNSKQQLDVTEAGRRAAVTPHRTAPHDPAPGIPHTMAAEPSPHGGLGC